MSVTASIAPQQLYAWLQEDSELALLDVREARAFVGSHLNLARMTPLSGLELDVRDLVPRLTTPVVLVDDGDRDGPALAAEKLLRRLGYTDIRMLAGGIAAWRNEALPLIDGYGTLVKAFGDQVRRRREVPTLNGRTLRNSKPAGGDATFIDVRPADEYAFLSLPGTGNHAGTELALRDWSDESVTAPWVLNCFSRTRAIIGTATLRLLGHPNAYFLEDGVMQWALDGASVVQNAQPALTLPIASDDELRRRADALIARHALPSIDTDSLARMQAQRDRTLYMFDLRPQANGEASDQSVRAVPGGQLLMHFEQLVGTRGARIVLVDDAHRLRAAVSSFWLTQLNQAEVFILDGELPSQPPSEAVPTPACDAPFKGGILPRELVAMLVEQRDRICVVDVGPSADFEQRHLPGALYLLPFTLDPLSRLFEQRGDDCRIVFSSPDGQAARLVARDARERWPACNALWLIGGTEAWHDDGRQTQQNWEPSQLLTVFKDDWGSVMRVSAARRDQVWEDYLRWERGLSERVMRDRTVSFRFF